MNIFVGNLAFSATEEGVRQLFEEYGTVATVRLATEAELICSIYSALCCYVECR